MAIANDGDSITVVTKVQLETDESHRRAMSLIAVACFPLVAFRPFRLKPPHCRHKRPRIIRRLVSGSHIARRFARDRLVLVEFAIALEWSFFSCCCPHRMQMFTSASNIRLDGAPNLLIKCHCGGAAVTLRFDDTRSWTAFSGRSAIANMLCYCCLHHRERDWYFRREPR